MPQPYSDDLRSKFLHAYAAGAGDLCRLAGQFGVSWGWAKKIRRRQLSSGQTARVRQQRHGFLSRVGAEQRELLCAWLREQPDSTDEEVRHRLATHGVAVSKSRVGQLLRQMGVRRKKVAPRPGARQRREHQAAR